MLPLSMDWDSRLGRSSHSAPNSILPESSKNNYIKRNYFKLPNEYLVNNCIYLLS